jgi:hypothetical protein
MLSEGGGGIRNKPGEFGKSRVKRKISRGNGKHKSQATDRRFAKEAQSQKRSEG